MTITDLLADLKSRINPAYAHQRGTESYERRLCVEAMESLLAENELLLEFRDHVFMHMQTNEQIAYMPLNEWSDHASVDEAMKR